MPQNLIHDPACQSSFATLLNQSTKDLAAYLGRILPAVFDDWWQTGVMSKLSYQQQQRTSQSGLTSLSGLDLAALLQNRIDRLTVAYSTAPPQHQHIPLHLKKPKTDLPLIHLNPARSSF